MPVGVYPPEIRAGRSHQKFCRRILVHYRDTVPWYDHGGVTWEVANVGVVGGH